MINEKPKQAILPNLYSHRCCQKVLLDLLENFDQDVDALANALDVKVSELVGWMTPNKVLKGLNYNQIKAIYNRISAGNLWSMVSFSRFMGAEGLFDECLSQFVHIHTDQYSVGAEFRICSVLASKMAAWLKDVTPLPIATVAVSTSYDGSSQTTVLGGFFNHPAIREFAMVFRMIGARLRPQVTVKLFDGNKKEVREFQFPLGDHMAAHAVNLIQEELDHHERKKPAGVRSSCSRVGDSKKPSRGGARQAEGDGRPQSAENRKSKESNRKAENEASRFGRAHRIPLSSFCSGLDGKPGGNDFTDIDHDG